MDLVEQRISYPDFLAVGGQGNAVAGTAMRHPRPWRPVPDRTPIDTGDFHRLQDLPGFGIGHHIAQEVVLIDVDLGGILVEDLHPDIFRELDLLNDLAGRDIGNLQQLAVGRHESELAIGAEIQIVCPHAAGRVKNCKELSGFGIQAVPIILQVRTHHQGLAVGGDLGTFAAFAVKRGGPDHPVGRKVQGAQAATRRQIEHIGRRARRHA